MVGMFVGWDVVQKAIFQVRDDWKTESEMDPDFEGTIAADRINGTLTARRDQAIPLFGRLLD
jgi:hypothetical protein